MHAICVIGGLKKEIPLFFCYVGWGRKLVELLAIAFL